MAGHAHELGLACGLCFVFLSERIIVLRAVTAKKSLNCGILRLTIWLHRIRGATHPF